MPGWVKTTVNVKPTLCIGSGLPGSESIPRSLDESPVTECIVSGPTQYQVTCWPRSTCTTGVDQR